jgi:hypothetical protein
MDMQGWDGMIYSTVFICGQKHLLQFRSKQSTHTLKRKETSNATYQTRIK